MKRFIDSGRVFHPLSVLAIAILAALVFAYAIVQTFDGETQLYLLYYFVPIGVPCVAFVFDRAERVRQLPRTIGWVDVPTVLLALSRAFVPVPFVSGHALFLTYALLTTRSGVARITAALVLGEVIFIKLFVWGDVSLVGGMLLGIAAYLVFRQITLRKLQTVGVNDDSE